MKVGDKVLVLIPGKKKLAEGVLREPPGRDGRALVFMVKDGWETFVHHNELTLAGAPEPRQPEGPSPLHRLHAAPALGRGGRSFDLAGWRWRPDGAPDHEERNPRDVAFRLALCWNLCEGIPTEVLENGWFRLQAEAIDVLLKAAGEDRLTSAHVDKLRDLRDQIDAAVAAANPGDGTLSDCEACEERLAPKKKRRGKARAEVAP